MAGCRLIVGLGNVGNEYENTRHNVGFRVVDFIAKRENAEWELDKRHESYVASVQHSGCRVIIAKPTTFMNSSGTAVSKLCGYYKIPKENVVVVYDDIAFNVGDFRMTVHEGTGGHNGVADVLQKIGGGFVRVRVGVGQKPIKQMDLKDYVLGKFSNEEIGILDDTMPEIFSYIKLLLDKEVEYVMNFANRKKVL